MSAPPTGVLTCSYAIAGLCQLPVARSVTHCFPAGVASQTEVWRCCSFMGTFQLLIFREPSMMFVQTTAASPSGVPPL